MLLENKDRMRNLISLLAKDSAEVGDIERKKQLE